MPDLRIQYDEEMVGAGHPTKEDTLNRLMLAEHDSAGLHQRATLLAQSEDPQTGADQAALYVKQTGGLSELFFRGSGNGAVSQLTRQGVVNAGQKGFITGLIPTYVSGTALGFGGGALDIAGAPCLLPSAFADLAAAGLGAGTWYFVEVAAPSSGFELAVGDFSLTTAAPAWSDALGYWERGGKRCVFAFKTGGSGNVTKFFCDGRGYWTDYPFTILSTSSPATSDTALSLGLPALGELLWHGLAYIGQSNAQEYTVVLTPAAATAGNGHLVFDSINSPGGFSKHFTMFADASQQVRYKTVWNGAGTLNLYLHGFALPAGMAR